MSSIYLRKIGSSLPKGWGKNCLFIGNGIVCDVLLKRIQEADLPSVLQIQLGLDKKECDSNSL